LVLDKLTHLGIQTRAVLILSWHSVVALAGALVRPVLPVEEAVTWPGPLESLVRVTLVALVLARLPTTAGVAAALEQSAIHMRVQSAVLVALAKSH
jgi:hypothetical protein